MRRFAFNVLVLPAVVIAITYAIFERDLRASGILSDPTQSLIGFTPLDITQILSPPPLQGPPEARPLPPLRDTQIMAQTLIDRWSDWMKDQGITHGTIAVARPNGQVVSAGVGRTADHPMPLGTLSTTVTGLCLTQILQHEDMPWDTTLGDLAAPLTALGVPPAPWSLDISLAELATFRSTRIGHIRLFERNRSYPTNAPQHLDIARQALSEDAAGSDDGHAYTNLSHYAILGAVIEAITGEAYASACQSHLLDPAETSATNSGQMAPYASFAGWEMSSADAARMAHHWFQDEQPWVADPSAHPLAGDIATGYQITGEGAASMVFAQGEWCARGTHRPQGGGMMLSDGRGLSVVALWQGCQSAGALYHLRFGLQNILR